MKTRYVIGLTAGIVTLGTLGIAHGIPKVKDAFGNFNQTIDSVVLEQEVTNYLTPIEDRLTVLEDSFGGLESGIYSNQELIQENKDSYAVMLESYNSLADRLDKLEQQVGSEQKVYCHNLDIPFMDSEFLICAKEETLGEQYSEPKVEVPVIENEQ